MKIVRTKQELQGAVEEARNRKLEIGLVPTMGGIHAGHLSLVRQCKNDTNFCVVSVFLNPKQFNNEEDLKTYPHDFDKDMEALKGAGVDLVFAPSAEEMYDEGETAPTFDLGVVGEVMEGKHRPGHFQGVTWIVSKLFRLVKPSFAYFGEKDFQQIAVIQRMIDLCDDINVKIIPMPVVREKDGLAMSSRNARLTPEQRAVAPKIYEALKEGVKAEIEGKNVREVHDLVVDRINSLPEMKVEYFNIVDAITLEEIAKWEDANEVVGCITVYCGDVRLIDHIHFTSRYAGTK